MAYSKDNLQPIGGQSKAGNAPQMWSYTAPDADAVAAIIASGYFNDASSVLKVGDLVYIWDSSVPTASLAVVNANASGVVDLTDVTALTVTDAT
jgi:hypothetical protein